jgi:hypothetical protein
VKWAESILEEDAKQHNGAHRASTFGFGTLIKTLVQASREQHEQQEQQEQQEQELAVRNLGQYFDEQSPSPSPDADELASSTTAVPAEDSVLQGTI